MKFLKYIFKPQFSWFETLALVALLVLTNNFVIFLVGGFLIGVFTAIVNGYVDFKEKEK